MAGKAVQRESKELTSRVNVINSETSVQTVQGKYSGSGADRRTLIEGKSEMRPYSYYSVVEGRVGELKAFQGACADIVEHGHYPLASLVADLNYGMEWRGRESWREGLDPSMTSKQRQTIDRVRGLMGDGLGDPELWALMLEKVGLSAEQITTALS